jgi:hypothetical protein
MRLEEWDMPFTNVSLRRPRPPSFPSENTEVEAVGRIMVKSVRNHPYLWENSGVKYDLVDIIDV